MNIIRFKMLSKTDQQVYRVQLMEKINSLLGKNSKGDPMIDFAKNGIWKGA